MNTAQNYVHHPIHERPVDVMNFLNSLDELDAGGPTGTGGREVIRKTIRLLNVTVHDHNVTDPSALASLYADLHKLEDAFGSIVEADPGSL